MSICTQSPTVSWTVNDVMRCFPASIVVLNKLGIDTCCGGTQTLGVAANNAGMAPGDLVTALLPCAATPECLEANVEPVDFVI